VRFVRVLSNFNYDFVINLLLLLSGILEVHLVYEGWSHNKLCESQHSPGCTFDIHIPIITDQVSPNGSLKCMRLEPGQITDFDAFWPEEAVNSSRMQTHEASGSTSVTCTINKLGKS